MTNLSDQISHIQAVIASLKQALADETVLAVTNADRLKAALISIAMRPSDSDMSALEAVHASIQASVLALKQIGAPVVVIPPPVIVEPPPVVVAPTPSGEFLPITDILFPSATINDQATEGVPVGTAEVVGGTGPFVWSILNRSDSPSGPRYNLPSDKHGHIQVSWSPGPNLLTLDAGQTSRTDTIRLRVDGAGSFFEKDFSVTVTKTPAFVVDPQVWYDNQNPDFPFSLSGPGGDFGFDQSKFTVTVTDPSGDFSFHDGYFTHSDNGPVSKDRVSNVVIKAVLSADKSKVFQQTVAMRTAHYPAATDFILTSATLPASASPGTVVGQLYAANPNNAYLWSLADNAGGLFTCTAQGKLTTAAMVTEGAHNVTVRLTDSSDDYWTKTPAITEKTITINVTPGQVLSPDNISMTVRTDLDNAMLLRSPSPVVIGAPTIAGMTGTPVWSITSQPGQDGALDSERPTISRYSIDPATGALSLVRNPSARTDDVTISVTNGSDTCTRTVQVTAKAVVGPTLHVGPGQTYPTMGPLFDALWDDAGGDDRGGPCKLAGAIILIHPGTSDDYYNTQDGGTWIRRRIGVPVTFRGMPGGKRPVFKGMADYYGKSGLAVDGHDCDVTWENIEIVAPAGDANSNIGAMFYEPSCAGDVVMRNCYIHNMDDGVRSGGANRYSFYQCEFALGGNGYYGKTHGLYLAGGDDTYFEDCLFWGAEIGHDFKNRAKRGKYVNCRFFDTSVGRASNQCNIPEGGVHEFIDCVFMKGPNSQSNALLKFGEDAQIGNPTGGNYRWGEHRLTLTRCTFLNLRLDSFRGGPALAVNVIGGVNADGSLATIVANDCEFFNVAEVNRFCTEGGYPAGFRFNVTGSTTLDAMPKLDLSHPGAGPWDSVSPLLPFRTPSGNNNEPANDGGQIRSSTGMFDLHIPASTAVGTVIDTMVAYGSPADGTEAKYSAPTWALDIDAGGRFAIDAKGALKVAKALTAGAYTILARVTQAGQTNTEYSYVVVD